MTRALLQIKGRLATVPQRLMRREKIAQEMKVMRGIVEFQAMETERARVAETRDTTTFQMIDEPEPAPQPFMPRRGFSTALAAIAGLLLGVAYLVARSVAQQATRPIPESVPQAVIHD
jgi:uncharacterized protein involved in exopolysaccharide biosynthesis